jgi:SAM-dependent methyltransferase
VNLRPEVELWESYGPLFTLEETSVFPPEEEEMSFYRDLRGKPGDSCVELGAGSGRLAGALAADGLTVGLEASSAMLALWPRRTGGLAGRVRGLAQEMPFLDGSLDMVLLTYNFLHCILDSRERQRVLTESARVLPPGGRLVLEACPAFALRPAEQQVERYRYEEGGVSLRLVEAVSRNPSAGTITFHMEYSGSAVPPSQGKLDLTLKLLSAGEILHEVSGQGFVICSVWGDYDLSPWNCGSSPRLLVLAERK